MIIGAIRYPQYTHLYIHDYMLLHRMYIYIYTHICFIYRCSFLINPRLGFLLFALSSSPRLCFWRPLIHGSVLIIGLSLHDLQAQWGIEPYSACDIQNEPPPKSKPSRDLRAVQLRWTLSIQAQQWSACKASIFAWRLWARRNSAAIGRRAETSQCHVLGLSNSFLGSWRNRINLLRHFVWLSLPCKDIKQESTAIFWL